MIDIKAALEEYNNTIIDHTIFIWRNATLLTIWQNPAIIVELLKTLDSANHNYEIEKSIIKIKSASTKEEKKKGKF